MAPPELVRIPSEAWCRDGHSTRPIEWGEEIWLFQVITEFQGLPRSEQRAFRLSQQESQASPYNHLRLIHDVVVQLA